MTSILDMMRLGSTNPKIAFFGSAAIVGLAISRIKEK